MAGFNVHSILVTGANRGIGFELVKQFLERSNPPEKIFATCRNPDGAQELKNLASRHPNLVIVQLEVTDPVSIKAAAARVEGLLKGSGLHLLINNAGIVKKTTLEAETPEYMSQVYATNTTGPLVISQAFLPLLKKAVQESAQKGLSCSKAAIINMSSEAGSIKNVLAWEFGQVVSYRCSKAALNMLTKCQSLAYRELGILCIALHPGWLQTTMGNTGGYQAPMTVDEGVRGIINTLSKLSEKETGAFINWEGNLLPW
ncbi:C-signal isoform X1 [Alligator mississippiensis]|uniref:C-signal isoform X1 n=1 Tax=Alligator mississippiensis TaxID=8496 RepID=UPI0003D0D290|nr:C-signal isoform X1 [Alligator mississippiensis]